MKLTQPNRQERKLLTAYYADEISKDLFSEEQARIRKERVAAKRRIETLSVDHNAALRNLDKALDLLTEETQLAYLLAGPDERRMLNQGLSKGFQIEKGKSTSMIRKTRASLSTLFATALEDGLVSTNPIRGVRIPAPLVEEVPDEDRAKALTRAEFSALLSAIPEDWHLFFEFLVGLRISEMIGLTWEHMELEASPHVKVREQFYRCQRRRLKSGAGRRDIPLAPRMTTRLIEHREANYSGPPEPVFTSDVGTELIRGKVADRVLNPARALVGLPWVSFHTFRHTCASLLFANGKDIKQIQTWLGHADASFTLRTYVHLLEEGVGSADFLDDAIEVGRGPRSEIPNRA